MDRELGRSMRGIGWRLRTVLLSAALLLSLCELDAQKFLWNVDFRTSFDNREYASMEKPNSMTLFGAVLSPSVGVGFGEGHSVHLGADAARYFGEIDPKYHFNLLLYYQYEGELFRANAGAFPRARLRGYYPKAFFNDDYFFNTVVDGTMMGLGGDDWMAELVADWVGMYGADNRERFYIMMYGMKRIGLFYGGVSFMMFHYACSEKVDGVVDNIWVYPHIGVDFTKVAPLERLDLKLGWINTFQNDRISGEGYHTPGGFQCEVQIQKWGVGIYNTLYAGKNLQPLYGSVDAAGSMYGDDLYSGSRFYSTEHGIYNRLEIYYEPEIPKVSEKLKLRVASVHHYDGRDWGWQQVIKLVINI